MPPLPDDIYKTSAAKDASAPLRQGEILTGLNVPRAKLHTIGTASVEFQNEEQPIVIILSQACDLDIDFHNRFQSDPAREVNTASLLPCVFLCQVTHALDMLGRVKSLGKEKWKSISQNNDVRYQFLQNIAASCDAEGKGLGELAIDFKRYLAVPTEEIYKRIELGELRRRCVLNSPYLESVCQRFAYYLARVALPEPHFSEPVVKEQNSPPVTTHVPKLKPVSTTAAQSSVQDDVPVAKSDKVDACAVLNQLAQPPRPWWRIWG